MVVGVALVVAAFAMYLVGMRAIIRERYQDRTGPMKDRRGAWLLLIEVFVCDKHGHKFREAVTLDWDYGQTFHQMMARSFASTQWCLRCRGFVP